MITIDQKLCIGCGGCVTACPTNIFSLGEDGKAQAPKLKRCMACMHCAAACPVRAIHFEAVPAAEEYPPAPSGSLERLVMSRRSQRHFQPETPDRALIEWALDTAEYAPSGHNERTHRWTVLWGRGETERVAELVFDWVREARPRPDLVAMARGGRNLITCGAPCILLCHSGPESPNHTIDAVIAMETVELLLVEKGLATCWAGYLQRLCGEVPGLKEHLGLPEGHKVRCALMAGLPGGETYPNIPWRPRAKTHWIGGAN